MERIKSNRISVSIIGEQESVDLIVASLKHSGQDISITASAYTYEEALLQKALFKTDILFLSASIEAIKVFDILKPVKTLEAATIVLFAPNRSHAYEAIREGIQDYLLFPFVQSDMDQLIQKHGSIREAKPNSHTVNRTGLSFEEENIIVSNRNGFQVLKIEDISHLEAEGSYCIIWLGNGEHVTSSRNMRKISELLKHSTDFIKVHKSYIINKKHIVAYDNSTASLLLSNNIYVSTTLSLKELLSYLQPV
ncbi:hypothetical protein DBR32_03660 [Taibaiella sp. KBW10]|uniref:LytR/AlgR family response regulator transcription factor n=1 Tax=Taibaiella sp. KBW10 TaxID=2153357 RepID=UPI000F5AE81C|nr:LytTR family DNA-binding domain-containing protein [Taibaiella sp. KBW10]RQO31913.1 hypothetical protein DBR32_03660 [Taibaiella sp. KBW10]